MVHCKGYQYYDATWEPENHLEGAQTSINEFWQRHHQQGTSTTASSSAKQDQDLYKNKHKNTRGHSDQDIHKDIKEDTRKLVSILVIDRDVDF